MAFPEDYAKGMDNFYSEILKSLKPGLSCILMHAGYDGEEMRGVMQEHTGYGAAWRQDDFNFFTSEKCKKLLAEAKYKTDHMAGNQGQASSLVVALWRNELICFCFLELQRTDCAGLVSKVLPYIGKDS